MKLCNCWALCKFGQKIWDNTFFCLWFSQKDAFSVNFLIPKVAWGRRHPQSIIWVWLSWVDDEQGKNLLLVHPKMPQRLKNPKALLQSLMLKVFLNVFNAEHKSAITDHVVQTNHNIKWDSADVIDSESDKTTRWVKEAIWIRFVGNGSIKQLQKVDVEWERLPVWRSC